MPYPASYPRLGVDDYLAGEEGGDIRHEYIDGQVYAMTGASDRHGLITGNIFAVLRPLLRGTPCQLFANDMKVRLNINQQDLFYYPDLLLSCDPTDRETYYRSKPCLLIEVLSDSTARLDSREKRFAYQTLPSLREYLLVSQTHREVQMFRRQEEWVLETCRAGQVRLDCLEFDLPLDLIYEDVPEQ
jgi:Uma2 family endonuclease